MRSVVETALRAVSYLFHLGLGLLLIGLAAMALLGPEVTFTIGILPWEGQTLAWILLALGVVAIVAVYLAIRRSRALLLLLWSLTALGALVNGCFLGRYYFGRDGPSTALLLVGGAALAVLGSWRAFRRKPRLRSLVSDRSEAA